MIKSIILLCSLVFIYNNFSFGQKLFPQKKVDEAYSTRLNDFKKNNFKENNIEETVHPENIIKKRNFIIDDYVPPKPVLETKGTLYIGPGNDTLLIDTNYTQIGDIVVYGYGVLIVDNAQLTLYGHLIGAGKGQVLLRNNAYLYVPQQYVSQYPQAFYDSSRFEAINSKIYGNTVYRTFLYDNSEYIARHVDFPYWNFRQLFNHAKLIIEDARMVGDLDIKDSCQVSFINCDTILPWFGISEHDSLDIQFPGIDTVNYYVFDSSTVGVTGIDYSVTFDSCRVVVWGVVSNSDSYIHIKNSIFSGTLRIQGNDTLHFNKLRDNIFYNNLNIPFFDRNFTASNSYCKGWCIYTYDNIVLNMDSCSWGESHAKENSKIYASNSVTLGFPSCVTTLDSGFYHFTGGRCRAFVSAWDNSTNLIENSVVIPDRPGGAAQVQNFAHDNSFLLAVNSYFYFKPYALDTSLIMFVYIDSLNTINTDTITNIPISGSAWLQAGLYNPTTFNQYKLYYQSVDSSSWIFINGATAPIDSNLFGSWNTSGLTAGDYLIKLTIWDSNNDSLSALRKVILTNTTSVNNHNSINQLNYSIYPNPTNGEINIKSPVLYSQIKIFDAQGNIVMKTTINSQNEMLNLDLPGGIYFLQVSGDNFTQTKKLEVIK